MQFYLISTPLARCSKKITHATPSSDLHLKAPNSEFLKSSPPLTLFLNCKQPFSLVGTYACLELELKDDGQVEAFLKNLVVNYMTALERNLDIRSQEAAPVLEAFSIFDPSCLPKLEDPAFKKYAVDEVKCYASSFSLTKITHLHSGTPSSTRCHHGRYPLLFSGRKMTILQLSSF